MLRTQTTRCAEQVSSLCCTYYTERSSVADPAVRTPPQTYHLPLLPSASCWPEAPQTKPLTSLCLLKQHRHQQPSAVLSDGQAVCVLTSSTQSNPQHDSNKRHTKSSAVLR